MIVMETAAMKARWANDAVYFGCVVENGHFTFNTWCRKDHNLDRMLPWQGIDGVLCPDFDRSSRQAALGYGGDVQTEGVARIHHKDGWTAMAFWDRSTEPRMGGNSVFFFRGTHSFAEMCALARQVFPEIWNRFTFEIVPEIIQEP